jgi:phosphatidate cytidylyltransferase
VTERNERDDKNKEHVPAEGVRIIPAEEAQAALEAGAAAGRRPDDQLRFGDVPPAPSGPRPTHRFPLPTSVDPAEVPHPPVAAPVRPEERSVSARPGRPVDADDAHDLRSWARRGRRSARRDTEVAGGSAVTEDAAVAGGAAEAEDEVTTVVPVVEPGLEVAAPWRSPTPSFAPPSTAPAVSAAPIVSPGTTPASAADPPTEPVPVSGVDAPPAAIPPSIPSESTGDSWDTGAWRSDAWKASDVPDGPYPGAEDLDAGAAVPNSALPNSAIPKSAIPKSAIPESADAGSADAGSAVARPDDPWSIGSSTVPEPWDPLPPRAAPTGWEPPPGWGPEPSAPDPTSWDAPLNAPAWESPLDSAEGMSPSRHSWTPPEAWADVPDGRGGPGGPDARSGSDGPPPLPVARTPAGPDPVATGFGVGDPPADPPMAAPWEAAPWEPEVASSAAGPARPDREPGADDRPPSDELPATPGPEPTTTLDEGITVTGGFGTDLPHWTDPPTGEVPRLRPGGEADPEPDDLQAWQAVGSAGGARWRDDAEDWDDLGALGDLGSDETRVGALDSSRTEHSDLYSFDEDFDRLDEERSGQHRLMADELPSEEDFEVAPERISTSVRASAAARAARTARARSQGSEAAGGPPASGQRDLGSAVVVGAGLVVLLIIAYFIGSKGLLVLSAAVLLACAIEVFGMVQRRGFKPATLLGLVATVGVVFAAYWRGTEALPLVTAVMFVATMCWYLFGVVEARPLANVSATLMAYLWVGLLGSFGALLLRAPHGRGLFLGAVLPVVAADIVAYLAGSRVGTRPLAPTISPGKTVEGVLAGGLAALVVGAIVGSQITPWGGVKHGLELGLVVAVLSPIGDLFESMIKRDLSVKDSGSALPGHGGLLDRFDSLLIVLPAAYYLVTLFGLRL